VQHDPVPGVEERAAGEEAEPVRRAGDEDARQEILQLLL
jgi:hypothetical protein